MISSVSFRSMQPSSSAQDLYSSPQRFQRTTPYEANAPEQKKGSVGKKVAIVAGIAVAAATALALISKNTNWLKPAENLAEDAKIWQKAWNGTKKGLDKAGNFIGDTAISAWNGVKNLFTKKPAEVPEPTPGLNVNA